MTRPGLDHPLRAARDRGGDSFPQFDARPEGAVLAALVMLGAVLVLLGGGMGIGWLLWGRA